MDTTCEICGREFKTSQGLRGHKNFKHQMAKLKEPPAPPVTEQLLSKLDEKTQKVEQSVESRDPDLLNKHTDTEATITEQLEYLTDQIEEYASQLVRISENVSKLSEEVQLAKTMSNPVNTDYTELKDAQAKLERAANNDINMFRQSLNDFKHRLDTIETCQYSGATDINNVLASVHSLIQTTTDIQHKLIDLENKTASIEQQIIRTPTGRKVEHELEDESEHTFREYRSPDGLNIPHRHSLDLIFGERWIDLAEPED